MSHALVWLRRDLRLHDHTPLSLATRNHESVTVCFVFDTVILDKLSNPADRRLTFIYDSLMEIKKQLQALGSDLILLCGDPTTEIPKLASSLKVSVVYTGRDYEPYAKKRDDEVTSKLSQNGIQFKSVRDQVIFESKEILNQQGGAFKVFTPYKNAWLKKLSSDTARVTTQKVDENKFIPKAKMKEWIREITLESLGFKRQSLFSQPGTQAGLLALSQFKNHISEYAESRNYPSQTEGTSQLSPHLRFGTISIRDCFRMANLVSGTGSETWKSELIWREFYQMLLDQFPHVASGKCFKPEYDKIKWPGSEDHYQAWCSGETGFPIVDAAMRHFNATGWMHNRLRMIVASFLVKDLLVDWRKGEAYFARHLLDYDLASNSGGWQWSASVGCDAQPYFRIFNPESQSEKFDADGSFIRSEIPELGKLSKKDIHNPPPLMRGKYPAPIVEHDVQRKKALALFKA